MEHLYFKNVFEEPIKDFVTHLNIRDNQRIVFSGKYGSGKTSFLRDFFNPDNQTSHLGSNKYEVFHLFPVNYSIASNEDIIRYIKYDLIIRLLEKAIDIKEIKLQFIDTLPYFIKKNLDKVLANIVSMIPPVGKDIVDTWEKINALKEKFRAFHDEANMTDGDKLINYLESLEAKDSSLYENDVITKIIANNISTKDKESILIIDDLDRVDPEHIFRILNVFAAHFDSSSYPNSKNKFGFSKVILVCDVKNIKNIFHYKYGIDVDFAGYTDKFFSSHIHRFDNKKAVTGIINSILDSIEFETRNKKDNNTSESITLHNLYFKNKWVASMISLFLETDHISLRNILKTYSQTIGYHYEVVAFVKNQRHRNKNPWQLPMIMQIKFILSFFGDKEHFLSVLKKCEEQNLAIEDYEEHASYLIYILAEIFHIHKGKDFTYMFDNVNLVVAPRVNFDIDFIEHVALYREKGLNGKGDYLKEEMFEPSLSQYWNCLYRVTQKLVSAGYIK